MPDCQVELTAGLWLLVALSALVPAAVVSLACWLVVRRA